MRRPGSNEQCLHSGVFIDIPAKTVHMWAGADSLELPAVARQWPGWRFTEHDGGLPAQAALSGRDGRAVKLPHDVLVAEAYATFYSGPEERDYRRLLQQGMSWSPARYRGLGKK